MSIARRTVAFVCFLLIPTAAAQLDAEPGRGQDLAERIASRLPSRFKIDMTYRVERDDGDQQPDYRHRYWITPDRTRGDQWVTLPEFGENLLLAGTKDAERSTLLWPDTKAYNINESHPISLTLLGASVSPVPIMFALQRSDAAGATAELISTENGTQTYRLRLIQETMVYPYPYTAIDVRDDRIVRFVMGESPERPALIVEYADYQSVGDGLEHPFLIKSPILPDEAGGLSGKSERRVQSLTLLAPDEPVPPIPVPDSYHIVDHIEGVTKYSDGRVIAPIQYGKARGGGTPSLPWNQIAVLLGVAGVVVAAVIYARRSVLARRAG